MNNKLAAAALIVLVGGVAAAQTPPTSAAPVTDNYYGAGNRIDIKTPVGGDLVIAGRVLNIAEHVDGDVLAAGWRVALLKDVSDDVRIAGGEVEINAPIDGDLTVAGGDVTVGPMTRVAGRAWIAGSQVRLEGVFARELRVAGKRVTLGGRILEPIHIITEELEILPTANVAGRLTYESPAQARIASGATITGPVTYRHIDAAEAGRARWPSAFSTFLFIAHLSIAGLMFFFLIPRFASAGVDTLRKNPGRSLLLGFSLLVTIPIAIVLLVVTILGAPLGLVLAAVYAVGLLLGILVTAESLGELEVKWMKAAALTPRWELARALGLGVLTLALLRSMLGGWIALPAIVLGMGALTLWGYRTYGVPEMPRQHSGI